MGAVPGSCARVGPGRVWVFAAECSTAGFGADPTCVDGSWDARDSDVGAVADEPDDGDPAGSALRRCREDCVGSTP